MSFFNKDNSLYVKLAQKLSTHILILWLCKAFMWLKKEGKKNPLSDHMTWFGDSQNMVLVYTGQTSAIDG